MYQPNYHWERLPPLASSLALAPTNPSTQTNNFIIAKSPFIQRCCPSSCLIVDTSLGPCCEHHKDVLVRQKTEHPERDGSPRYRIVSWMTALVLSRSLNHAECHRRVEWKQAWGSLPNARGEGNKSHGQGRDAYYFTKQKSSLRRLIG
jgi:hypothetical protein